MKKRSNLIFLILTVLLTLPAVWALFHKGFFLSDDGNWMIIRFSAFYDSLKNGQLPVRFLSRLNNGYGYPVADFLYPLFMYVGVPIHLLGFSFVNTIKIVLIGSMISSSVFSFLWLRKKFDNVSSLVGAIAYSLFPYHLWDMYKRGSVGEVLALGIVPFVLWAIEVGSLPLAGIGYGLLILSHNSLALLFIPVLFGYQLLKKNSLGLMKSLKAIVVGLLLSCFFWLPALYDKQFTVFDTTSVSEFANYFVSDFMMFGFSTLVALLGGVAFLRNRDWRFIYFFIISIVSLFLSLSVSAVIWENLPFINFIQFPFRVLSLLTLGVGFLIAYQINKLGGKFKISSAIVYLILVFVSAWPFLVSQKFQDYPETFYSTNQDTTTVRNEYMPKWIKNLPSNPAEAKVEVIGGQEKINTLKVSPNNISAQGYFPARRTMQINIVYFPGWEVIVDGKIVPIDYNSNGLIRFDVSSGNHSIEARFRETKIRVIADLTSLCGLLLVLFLFLSKKYRKL